LVTIFAGAINLLNDLLVSQTNAIKKSLNTNSFYALELYQALTRAQDRWELTVTQLLGEHPAVAIIGETAGALRGACLRSFPEILVDVRTPAPAATRDVNSSSVADITYSVSRALTSNTPQLIPVSSGRL
jgi:exocyst complex protein 7